MSYGYIYLIKDHWNNKVYVGQKTGLSSKTQNYFGSGKIIKQVIVKRKHLLEKRILGYCETKEELDEAEKICIEFFNSRHELYGYNISSGGIWGATWNGRHHSEETKYKMSKSSKGRKCSLEHRKNMSISRKLTHNSATTKKKISDSKKGIKLTKEHKMKIAKSEQLNLDVEKILDLYFNQHLSMRKIAKLFNCSYQPIRQRIKFTEKYL